MIKAGRKVGRERKKRKGQRKREGTRKMGRRNTRIWGGRRLSALKRTQG